MSYCVGSFVLNEPIKFFTRGLVFEKDISWLKMYIIILVTNKGKHVSLPLFIYSLRIDKFIISISS